MFLAILRYKVSPQELEPYIESHIRFLEEAYSKNAFIVSGQMIPDKGRLFLSSQRDKTSLESSMISKFLSNLNY